MQGATPIVHYFAREWVKMGHQVKVFNFAPKYPRLFYWISRRFQHRLNSKLGMLVPLAPSTEGEYQADGVCVNCVCLKKVIPHSRYSNKQIKRAFNHICQCCEREGVPDFFIGHWDNPQLELLSLLKNKYYVKTALVLHGNVFDFEKKYGENGLSMLKQLDAIGFRSMIGKANYVIKYGDPKKSFVASSGVSEPFLKAGINNSRNYDRSVKHFIYIGSLISRKHPVTVLEALVRTYPSGNFKLTYIGDGAEKERIIEVHKNNGNIGELCFTGRIPREKIIEHLIQSDIFVMVSQNETFGLVYLEAMALGVIPVGSKGEGIDGVIQNGENGFLCNSGDVDELARVLEIINNMPKEKIVEISNNAFSTAQEYSDYKVAEKYLNSIIA